MGCVSKCYNRLLFLLHLHFLQRSYRQQARCQRFLLHIRRYERAHMHCRNRARCVRHHYRWTVHSRRFQRVPSRYWLACVSRASHRQLRHLCRAADMRNMVTRCATRIRHVACVVRTGRGVHYRPISAQTMGRRHVLPILSHPPPHQLHVLQRFRCLHNSQQDGPIQCRHGIAKACAVFFVFLFVSCSVSACIVCMRVCPCACFRMSESASLSLSLLCARKEARFSCEMCAAHGNETHSTHYTIIIRQT